MVMSGQCELPAPVHAVWHFLATPAQVSQCVPGLAAWECCIPDTQFRLWLRFPFAPAAQPALPVTLTWVEQQPPTSLHLALAAPFGAYSMQSIIDLTLHPLPPLHTQLHFAVNVAANNRFAEQLLRQYSPHLIDAFFVAMRQRLLAIS